MIPLWLIGALAAVIALIGSIGVGYKHGHSTGAQEVQAQWEEEKAQAAIKSQELQASMDKLREGKNREVASLNRTVRALSYSLRDRPERPASASASAGDGASGCTGSTLYRPDSAFLVGEAERADTIRIALKACQSAYQAAQQ